MTTNKVKEAGRVGGIFLAYLAIVVVIGALLAPWAWAVVQGAVARGWASSLANVSFRRVADRVFLGVGLAGLYPLLRLLRLPDRASWGWGAAPRATGRALAIGLGFGILTMGLLIGIQLAMQLLIHVPGRGWSLGAAQLAAGLGAGLVISIIEETFFRGALYSAWERVGPGWAVVVPAILYGCLHFVRSHGPFEAVHWWSGFTLVAGAFDGLADAATIGPLLTLVAAGLLLGVIRTDAGHVFYGLGVHTGWVAVVRVARKLTSPYPDQPHGWLIGNYDDVTGYLAFVWLLLLLGAYLYWRHRRGRSSCPS